MNAKDDSKSKTLSPDAIKAEVQSKVSKATFLLTPGL